MPLSKQAKEGIKKEYLAFIEKKHWPLYHDWEKLADWFLRRFEEEGEEKIAKIRAMKIKIPIGSHWNTEVSDMKYNQAINDIIKILMNK